jgi:hypothetical protein
LLGYLYASFKPEEFITEIKLKNPPFQLFEPYTNVFTNNNNNNNDNNDNNDNNKIVGQFISDLKLNLLSLNNLEIFVEESQDLDIFKKYLKSRNISTKQYFANKLGEAKEKNLIIPNKYFLVFTKELDGDIFLNSYVQFTKKKTLFEIKKNLKLSIENKITIYESSFEKAKLINLENPFLKPMSGTQFQVVNEPSDLFYKGSKILSHEINYLKKILTKLENDQFNFEIILDKPLISSVKETSNFTYFATGITFGLFLSLGIIFYRKVSSHIK